MILNGQVDEVQVDEMVGENTVPNHPRDAMI